MLGLYLPLQRSESAVFTSEHPKNASCRSAKNLPERAPGLDGNLQRTAGPQQRC